MQQSRALFLSAGPRNLYRVPPPHPSNALLANTHTTHTSNITDRITPEYQGLDFESEDVYIVLLFGQIAERHKVANTALVQTRINALRYPLDRNFFPVVQPAI